MTTSVIYQAPFKLSDQVIVDGGDITCTVIGICFYPAGTEIRVSWWTNGELRETWVAEWRCLKVYG